MNTVTITQENAFKAYSIADDNGKEFLSALLGETPKAPNIKERIKTFEDACEALGIKPEDVLHSAHSSYLTRDIEAINAFTKLTIIARALNESWEPDWTNDNQYKYYPWFNMESGSGLSFDVYVCWRSYSTVGSRLCFKSRELAEYAGKQFISIYTEMFILK